MKLLLIALVAVSVSGCATLQRITNRDGMTNDERKAQIAEAQAREVAKQDIEPGMSYDDFKAKWDDPDRVEFIQGYYVLRYNNHDQPVDFYFKDNKLAQWQFDDRRAAEIRNERFQDRALAQQAESARQQRILSTIGAMGSANHTQHCVTRGIGNTAYTDCH